MDAGYKTDDWKKGRKSVGRTATTAVCVPREVVGVSMTKPSISIGSLLPDLPQVPESHGLDLGKHCLDACVTNCVCV